MQRDPGSTNTAGSASHSWHSLLLFAALTACAFLFSGCYPDGGGGPVVSISMQPQINTLAVGATQQFTATIANGDGHVAGWNLFQPINPPLIPLATANTGLGTITQDGKYTAPSAPPVFDYGGAAGLQGAVGINVTAQKVSGQTVEVNADSAQTIVILAPSVTAGFVGSAAVTVKLGGTYKFQPYAVGAQDRTYTLQVQGVTGGSTTFGTITQDATNAGLYMAPAAVPVTGPTVTITVVSKADPARPRP